MEMSRVWTSVVAGILALLFALLAATPAMSAGGGQRIDSVNPDYFTDTQSQMEALAVNMSGGRGIVLENLSVSAGDELRIYLEPEMFLDRDGEVMTSLSSTQVRRVSIAIARTTATTVFEELSVEYDSERRTGYIKIEFIEPMVSTYRRSFRASIRLKVGGAGYTETEFQIGGSVANTEIKLEDADQDYVFVQPNEYLNPSVHISGITVDLGRGVHVIANLFGNRRYYGAVTVADSPSAENAVIALSYSFSYINLNVGARVNFVGLDRAYYVYNGNGDYVGTSEDDLPAERTLHLTEEHYEHLEVAGRRTAEELAAEAESGGSGGRR